MRPLTRDYVFQHYDRIAFYIKSVQESCYDDFEFEEDVECLDAIDIETRAYETSSFFVRVASKTKKQHAKDVSDKLSLFFRHANVSQLLLIPLIKKDIFNSDAIKYQEISDTYNELVEFSPSLNYSEALEIDEEDATDFVKIIYYLVTHNPNFLEFTLWFDKNENFCFFINKKGNLHITDLSENNAINELLFAQLGCHIDDVDQFD